MSSPSNSALTIVAPASPGSPGSHFAPSGIVKSKTAALVVPELTTEAELHGVPVVVDPTVTVAAVPGSPFSPLRLEY